MIFFNDIEKYCFTYSAVDITLNWSFILLLYMSLFHELDFMINNWLCYAVYDKAIEMYGDVLHECNTTAYNFNLHDRFGKLSYDCNQMW